jgi:hypothetical protein
VAVRESNALFLEVLEQAPSAGVPIEVDVYDGANPGTMLATIENASEVGFQPQIDDVGSFSFRVSRHDPKSAVCVNGNLVKFKIGGVYRFGGWIEEPEDTLVSREEEAGEIRVVAGRGGASYLERAEVYPPVWPVAAGEFHHATVADNGGTGTTTLVVARPSSVASGNVLVAAIEYVGGSGTSITPPKGWTLVQREDNGTAVGLAVYRRTAGAAEASSWTWKFGAATKATGIVTASRNVSPDVGTWSTAFGQGGGTAIGSPSVSVGIVDGVLLTFAATTANTTISPPSGLAELAERAATGRTLEGAYLNGPALGDTGTLTATAGATGTWASATVFLPGTGRTSATYEGDPGGAILLDLIARAQGRGAIPLLTTDFAVDVDSTNEPWADEQTVEYHVGTSLLDVWRQLVAIRAFESEIDTNLKLHAWVNRGVHREDTVILRKARHIRGEVKAPAHDSGLRTRFLLEGAGGRVVEVADPALEDSGTYPLVGRREGFLSVTNSDDATQLQRAGEAALEAARLDSEALVLPVVHGPAEEGLYEPYVDYGMGDWIGYDGEGDGEVVPHRIVGWTIAQDGDDYTVELNLNSVYLEALLRLKRRLDAILGTGSGTSSGSGGSAGGLGGGGATGGVSSGLVAVDAGDGVGFLSAKVVTAGGGITSSVVGTPGSKQLELSVPVPTALRIREADGAPDVSPVTTIKVSNGDLTDEGGGIVKIKTAAEAAGGGGASVPVLIQGKIAGTAISSLTLDQAPANGSTLLLYVDGFNTGTSTAVSSTNTTWTKVIAFTGAGGAKYDLWIGRVSGGAGGTVISITHPNAFCSAGCIEIADVVTPTLGVNLATGTGMATSYLNSEIAAVAAGHLVAFCTGPDNTSDGNGMVLFPSIPVVGIWGKVSIAVGYSAGKRIYAGRITNGGNNGVVIAEIT